MAYEYKHNGYGQFVRLGDDEDPWDKAVTANASTPTTKASPLAFLSAITDAFATLGKPAPAPVGIVKPGAPPFVPPKRGLPIVPIALVAGGLGLFWWLKKGK